MINCYQNRLVSATYYQASGKADESMVKAVAVAGE
jgi:hypothetical protein